MIESFTQRLHVRAYECDSFGHVNNSVYIQYLQQATLDALGIGPGEEAVWAVRRLAIEYHKPARYGDELQIAVWPLNADDQRLSYGYQISLAADDAPVASAQIDWMHYERATRRLLDLPPQLRLGPPDDGQRPAPLKPFAAPRDNGAFPFQWQFTVRRYELDTAGCAGPANFLNWIEAAFFNATATAGWTVEKMRTENFISLQYRHDAEFFGAAVNGDRIEIRSRLIDIRRVRATWVHEIYRTADNFLLVRDYSTGAFLDWEGHVRAGPMDVLQALTRGGAPSTPPADGD